MLAKDIHIYCLATVPLESDQSMPDSVSIGSSRIVKLLFFSL